MTECRHISNQERSLLSLNYRKWRPFENEQIAADKLYTHGTTRCCRTEGVSGQILLYVAFCTIMAISQQKETGSRDCSLLLSNDFQGFFIVHSTIDTTAHSRPFNSLKHCICTTSMTNIRPSRDSNPVPLEFRTTHGTPRCFRTVGDASTFEDFEQALNSRK